MKRVRRVKGDLKESLKRDPVQAFDGIADQIDLPYSERVIGIGDFKFVPTPRPTDTESTMARLWQGQTSGSADVPGEDGGNEETAQSTGPKAEHPVSGSVTVRNRWRRLKVFDEDASDQTAPPRGTAMPIPSVPPGKKYLLIETNEELCQEQPWFPRQPPRASSAGM